MARQSEKLQPSLFDEDEPRVVLAAAQMVDLAAWMEVLLRQDRDGAGKRGDRR